MRARLPRLVGTGPGGCEGLLPAACADMLVHDANAVGKITELVEWPGESTGQAKPGPRGASGMASRVWRPGYGASVAVTQSQ